VVPDSIQRRAYAGEFPPSKPMDSNDLATPPLDGDADHPLTMAAWCRDDLHKAEIPRRAFLMPANPVWMWETLIHKPGQTG